jgi:hypothetical protein
VALAIADSRPIAFKKSMERVGTLIAAEEPPPVDAPMANRHRNISSRRNA